MYNRDRLIFVRPQITVHPKIQSLLISCFCKKAGQHGLLIFDPRDRLVVDSIRRPFNWCASVWSYDLKGYKSAIVNEVRIEVIYVLENDPNFLGSCSQGSVLV